MNRTLTLLPMGVFAVAGLVLLLGWGAATAERGGAAPAARRHVVEIKGFEFEPAELVVAAGDTVVWINRDFATAEDEAWDSGSLDEDATWQMIAEASGRQPYFCRFHPTMKGMLVVE
jgi:plastocyanin